MIARHAALTVLFICLGSTAFGQIDTEATSADLRAKYGRPIAREIFVPRVGLEVVVDYGESGRVCRIQLPAMAPTGQSGVQSTGAVDEFLAEMIPLRARGKELRSWNFTSGINGALTTEYENISITETRQGQTRTGMTVAIKRPECSNIVPKE